MLEELETDRQNYKQMITLSQLMERLLVNVDFRQLIVEHYFTNYPLYLLDSLSQYDKGSKQYDEIVRELDSISVVRSYLFGLIDKGQWAVEELKQIASIPDGDDE